MRASVRRSRTDSRARATSSCLQIAQPAVNRAQMIERRAAAEVVALDQRHRQAALRRVVRDRQAVDPAADDEHVEGRCRSDDRGRGS